MRFKKPRSTKVKEYSLFVGKVITLVSFIGASYFGYKEIFTVKKTQCLSQIGSECPEPVQAEMNSLVGQNILNLDTQLLEEKIVKGLPSSNTFTIKKELPGTVKGSLDQAKELALLRGSSSSASYVVLDNLYISESTSTGSLRLSEVVIEYPIDVTVGEKIQNKRLLQSIGLLLKMKENYLSYRSYTVATDSARVLLKTNQEALFDLEDDLDTQLISLQVILNNEIEPKPDIIDMRFQKPVLRYLNKDAVLY